MLALTTEQITHGGPRRTTTSRTSPWYVALCARARAQRAGVGRRARRCADRMRPAISLACAHAERPRSAWRKLQTAHGSDAALRPALSLSSANSTAAERIAAQRSVARVRVGGAGSAVRWIGRATCDIARLCTRGPRVRGARGDCCKLHDTNVLVVLRLATVITCATWESSRLSATFPAADFHSIGADACHAFSDLHRTYSERWRAVHEAQKHVQQHWN